MSKSLVLLKLGGSVITEKEKPNTLREAALHRLVSEIAQAQRKLPNTLFIIGHGQGSFAHVPAVKYKTLQGFQDDQSRIGMSIVQDSAAMLNRIVVQEFIKAGLPAVSLYASNTLVTRERKVAKFSLHVLEEYLKKELLPVTCGDVLVDEVQGCTIWSTEEILALFARKLKKKGWNIDKIVHVVEVDGVYDLEKHVVPEITRRTWSKVKKAITPTKGFDVTGGMGLKVEESLAMAKLGVPSFIISGLREGNLLNVLTQKAWVGTRIQ